jgi:hypothetical protein
MIREILVVVIAITVYNIADKVLDILWFTIQLAWKAWRAK